MIPKLFLLKPNFADPKIGDDTLKYYCPHSAFIEGLLTYYPILKSKLDIIHVDFPRPRNRIIELLGEDNQSCPSLIIELETADNTALTDFKRHSFYLFSNDTKVIARYLAKKFGIGTEHP